MLSRVPMFIARHLPRRLKAAIHRSRFLDNASMFVYGLLLRKSAVTIEAGPLSGMKLAPSRHVSHAHVRGDYEEPLQEVIDREVKQGAVCYDLGASIGYLTLLMARRASRVFAFEPAPHAAEEIQRHLDANDMTNVTVVPSPVSNDVREVRFCVTDVAYGSAINDEETRWPVLNLQTITLNDFVQDNPPPDFMKIDVEGEEGRVLQGASNILKERKVVIFCEVHGQEPARQVQDTLDRFGYEARMLDGEPLAPPYPDEPFHVIVRPASAGADR